MGQVSGMDFLLDAWEAGPDTDLRWLAYALATAFHETDRTMQPVRERGGADYFFRMYDPASPLSNRAALARRMLARPGDGVLFYGRGHVQLTWRENYRRAGALAGQPLEAEPDLALQPAVSARVMFAGMRAGLFTGKRFAHYFPDGGLADWINARRIINGLDRAEDVAGYAQAFYRALHA